MTESLIVFVAKLRAHCAQEPGYFTELERLLGALDFRPGDAKLLEKAVLEFSRYGDDESRRIRDMLHRYQAMADHMEAKIHE